MKTQKILIVNPFGIGDVLFTTPLMDALKAHYPGVVISYLGNGRTMPFLQNDPRIDKVFSYERDEFIAVYRRSPWQFFLKWQELVDKLRQEKFDLAFDFSLTPGIGLALKLAGIPERIGYNYKGRGWFLTRSLPLKGYEGRHVAQYYLDLLKIVKIETHDKRHKTQEEGLDRLSKGDVINYSSDPSGKSCDLPGLACVQGGPGCPVSCVPKLSFFCSSPDFHWAEAFLRENAMTGKVLIGISPGGGASWGGSAGLKRWPAENYAKLADKIVEKAKAQIILLGDKAEEELCRSVAAAMSHNAIVAAGRTGLGQAAALMQRCRFVIVNDGGPLHVAVASGVRTVSIFGPVDENVYGPFPKDGHVVVTKSLPCRPCYRNFRMSDCPHQGCLRSLGVDEVYNKLEELL